MAAAQWLLLAVPTKRAPRKITILNGTCFITKIRDYDKSVTLQRKSKE
jgi:hypothetical protein